MRGAQCLPAALLIASLAVLQPAVVTADDSEMAKAHENYQSYCQKCHGEQGKGDGPGSTMLNPKPRDFADCANMQKRSDAELVKVIGEGGESIGMSADMQPWGGTLSETEIQGLVKFVRSFCKQPAAAAPPK